jgi:hypothetical protein
MYTASSLDGRCRLPFGPAGVGATVDGWRPFDGLARAIVKGY